MSIDLFAAFAVDPDKESKGVPTPLPGCGDTKFFIAREKNDAYSKLLQLRVKQHRAVLDSKGKEAEAKSDEILREVVAKTILVGWEGTVNYKGKSLAYSVENALQLLSHKDFMERVMAVSANMELFKLVQDEEDVKN